MSLVGIEIENNDTTPMEAVVRLIGFVFGKSTKDAFSLMLKIHREGRAHVAVFDKAQLLQIKGRLDDFLLDMDMPLSYRVIEDPPHDPALLIRAAELPTWDAFLQMEAAELRRSKFVTVLFATIIVLLVVIVGLLIFG